MVFRNWLSDVLLSLRDEQPVHRQGDDEMQHGPRNARTTPPELLDEVGAGRPTDRTREACEQRDAGDGIAGITPVEPGRSGKGRLIEAEPHTNADDRPRYC